MQTGPQSQGLVTVNAQAGTLYMRPQNLDASWSSFDDSVAGLFQYEYSLVHNKKLLLPFKTSNANSPSATFVLDKDQMRHGDVVEFKVKARNFALVATEILGSKIIFDLHPPSCRSA